MFSVQALSIQLLLSEAAHVVAVGQIRPQQAVGVLIDPLCPGLCGSPKKIRMRAAGPVAAFGIGAGLAALRCINSFKANTFGLDLAGVFINDANAACEVVGKGWTWLQR